jgi:hypothetical protein
MGGTSLELGRAEDAVSSLLHAVNLKPEGADLHHLLGLAYFRLGNREAVRHDLQIVLELNPCLKANRWSYWIPKLTDLRKCRRTALPKIASRRARGVYQSHSLGIRLTGH